MCKLRVWWLHYIGTSHTLRSPYYENFCTTKVTILWLYIVQNVQVTSMVTVLYRHKSHIAITILWKFWTTKVTILWLYIVQNVQVTSMVTALYRHKSHIAITIIWKFLYYQGHHTVTLHSTKCASYEYGDCTI